MSGDRIPVLYLAPWVDYGGSDSNTLDWFRWIDRSRFWANWRCTARAVHDLVRAVAPPFPGAFTEVNGCRLALLATRVDDQPVRHAARAPCLYAADGAWYADCVDGRRLKILELALDGNPVFPSAAPPVLSNQPLALI